MMTNYLLDYMQMMMMILMMLKTLANKTLKKEIELFISIINGDKIKSSTEIFWSSSFLFEYTSFKFFYWMFLVFADSYVNKELVQCMTILLLKGHF